MADRHRGVPDLDDGAVLERGLLDTLTVDEYAVGRAEVDDADPGDRVPGEHADLGVPARDTRVVDPQVGLGAASDHDAWGIEWVLHPVHLEHHAGSSYGRVGDVPVGRRGHLCHGGAADPEPSCSQLVGVLERDRDRTGEHVALFLRVLTEHVGELVGEGGAVRREPLVVRRGQLHVEVVRDQPPVAGEDLRRVVDLTLEGCGDLDGLYGASESAREGSGNELLQTVLEPLQYPHGALLSLSHLFGASLGRISLAHGQHPTSCATVVNRQLCMTRMPVGQPTQSES